MEEKKIATSVDVLINVGQFEHLQITKYAEKKITYENENEMIQKEDKLTDELIQDIIRTMRSMPDKLGKKTNAVVNIEEKIKKKIPTWLEEGSEPNIANLAKNNSEKSMAEASIKLEQKKNYEKTAKEETDLFLNGKSSIEQPKDPIENKEPDKQEQTTKTEENKTQEKSSKSGLDDDLFGDENLFK